MTMSAPPLHESRGAPRALPLQSGGRTTAGLRMRRTAIILAVALAWFAADAHAQSEAAIALGLSVASYDPTGHLSTGQTSIGLAWRVKSGNGGFGPAVGFSWHSLGVQTVAGGERVYLGKLRVRPVMAGVGYSWTRGQWSLQGSVVGGYAFNRLSVDDRARPAVRSALGASFVSFDVEDGLAWRTQVSLWYDVAPRVGVSASIGYFGQRPVLTTTSDMGTVKTRLDGACTLFSFGLVYGIF